jgi:hypothetical protein
MNKINTKKPELENFKVFLGIKLPTRQIFQSFIKISKSVASYVFLWFSEIVDALLNLA